MRVALESHETDEVIELPVGDWQADATEDEVHVLSKVEPTAIDIGCGPGRIAHALAVRGVPAMGIDVSASALSHARRTGATVIERSVFSPLPAEGRWGTAILLDGNIGIGGDPVALLSRVSRVIAPNGLVLAEVGATGSTTDVRRVRVCVEGQEPGPWFCWARVSADAIGYLGSRAGLELIDIHVRSGRHFAWLRGNPHGC